MPDLKFLFSDAPVPTWWSQLPDKRPLLTGWLGGPLVNSISGTEEFLFRMGIDSLAYLFGCTTLHIKDKLREWHIENWHTDPFSCGAYSYMQIKTPTARKIFQTPVAATLYWAGEALYEGPHIGTVEAALISGRDTALRMINV
jgi:hypothetical protein